MIVILEYVKEHSTLILVVLGLILFAIIGYYADKTNFGQGKNRIKIILNNHLINLLKIYQMLNLMK